VIVFDISYFIKLVILFVQICVTCIFRTSTMVHIAAQIDTSVLR
jgi:hypothetical protein